MKMETSKMELEIPSAEEPVATRRNVPLAISDFDHIFVYHKCNKTVPFRPKGGEVYVFRPDDPAEINDWVSDGQMFSCEGTRSNKNPVRNSTRKNNALLSVGEIMFKPVKNFSFDAGCFKFMQKTNMPHTIECLADITKDSPDLFT